MAPILSCDAYAPGDVMHGIQRASLRADLPKSPATSVWRSMFACRRIRSRWTRYE